MREKLEKLLENCYAKYSDYQVSAICVMNDRKEFSGVNVENASYGATICAERVAITKAISEGYKKGDFKELHVMVNSEKLGSPCFICRQVISELLNQDVDVVMYSKISELTLKVADLCPYPFGEDNL